VVLAFSVLEHVTDLDVSVQEIARVLNRAAFCISRSDLAERRSLRRGGGRSSNTTCSFPMGRAR